MSDNRLQAIVAVLAISDLGLLGRGGMNTPTLSPSYSPPTSPGAWVTVVSTSTRHLTSMAATVQQCRSTTWPRSRSTLVACTQETR